MEDLKKYKYDVAISFAEEDKNAALAMAQALEKIGLKSYYYPDDRDVSYGTNLEDQLVRIYSTEAKYAIVLFSEEYFRSDKIYTKIELSAIQKRMDEEADVVYMLPVRLKNDFSLAQYPSLDKLIYFKWDYAPDVIAKEISKLLGKELLNAEENAGAGNIIYNYGNQAMFIAGSTAENINQSIVFSSGENPVIISKKDGEGVSVQQIIFNKPKDTKYPCPYCSIELDKENYGVNKCKNCGKVFYIENPAINTFIYKTLDKGEAKEYNKVRAHIRNKIRNKDYEAAYQYCLKAEEIAPAESCTWEHFALTEFLQEIYREKSNRLPTYEIIKLVKSHTEKCKDYGISDKGYDGMVLDIANRLFAIEKARINSLSAQYQDDLGYDKWTKRNFQYLQTLLKSFEICFSLYADSLFLEEYVNELAKPNKWIERIPDTDEIRNTISLPGFNASEKFRFLVNKIRERKIDYIPPIVAEQRVFINAEETANLKSENHGGTGISVNTDGQEINITFLD